MQQRLLFPHLVDHRSAFGARKSGEVQRGFHTKKATDHKQSTAYARGLLAEQNACDHYQKQGYSILEQRYKTSAGEIDLIALKERQLCFVEVKQRSTIAQAAESITARQAKRIYHAASLWLQKNPAFQDYDCRFDAALFDRYAGMELRCNVWP